MGSLRQLSWSRLLFSGLSLAWIGLVSFVSSQADPLWLLGGSGAGADGPAGDSGLTSPVGHFLAFAVLATLLRLAVGLERKSSKAYLAILAAAAAFAAIDEVHQTFTPGRTGSAADVGIDIAGALSSLICCRLVEMLPIPRGLVRRRS